MGRSYCTSCMGTGLCLSCEGAGHIDDKECDTCAGTQSCRSCRGNGHTSSGSRTARSSGLTDLSAFRSELRRPPRQGS